VESLWSLRREQVDPHQFTCGHLGPYLLGPTVRATLLGDVIAALHRSYEEVVEIERYAALRDTSLAGPDCPLLADLAHVSTLRHRHIAPIVGAGMEGGAPYVVRPHRLGRTLAEALARGPIDPELAGAILHAVADALAWLADQGPAPGACAMGGLDESDIFLSYDGDVQLLGIGTKLARAQGRDPVQADLSALHEIADRLDVRSIERAASVHEASVLLRHAHRAGCADRAYRIGALLRARFESAMHRERALYGLPLLH
jgi:hypothetical protein